MEEQRRVQEAETNQSNTNDGNQSSSLVQESASKLYFYQKNFR